MRTDKQRAYHAAKERQYRASKRLERDLSLMAFGNAATKLIERHGFTVGQLVDLIVQSGFQPTATTNGKEG